VLSLVTRLAHRHKPYDWLFADVAVGVLLVVYLCSTGTAVNATVPVALQNHGPFSLPIV